MTSRMTQDSPEHSSVALLPSTSQLSEEQNSSQQTSILTKMFASPTIVLAIWLLNNIGVTLLNKASFQNIDFRYPYALTVIHMSFNTLGSQAYKASQRRGKKSSNLLPIDTSDKKIRPDRILSPAQKKAILLFSVIFSANIAIGNVSLRYVSVNFNQVMRSLVPAITLSVGILQGKRFALKRKLMVCIVVIGVACACYGDMSYTALGFTYTVLCVCLAAAKVIASGEMLTGELKLGPVELLAHMAPLALLQCGIVSFFNGEMAEIASRWNSDFNPFNESVGWYPISVVMLSGISSFTLNLSSLSANKLTSPLTLCIAANVKQVLMMGLSTILFNVPVSFLNGGGIFIVLIGSAGYSYVCLNESLGKGGARK